jgi:hypothetical protein
VVGTHPPVLVDHFNVGDDLALNQVNFIAFGLFIVILDHGSVAACGSLMLGLGFGLRGPRHYWNWRLRLLGGKRRWHRSALRLRLRLVLNFWLGLWLGLWLGSTRHRCGYSNRRRLAFLIW